MLPSFNFNHLPPETTDLRVPGIGLAFYRVRRIVRGKPLVLIRVRVRRGQLPELRIRKLPALAGERTATMATAPRTT